METHPLKPEKIIALPTGIYLVGKEFLDGDERLLSDEHRQEITFEVLEAVVQYIMLMNSNIDFVFEDDSKATLALIDKEEKK